MTVMTLNVMEVEVGPNQPRESKYRENRPNQPRESRYRENRPNQPRESKYRENRAMTSQHDHPLHGHAALKKYQFNISHNCFLK